MAGKQRTTIRDVAKAAGVSTQTVSRVLNNRHDVAPDTRRMVAEVIEALGYRPSQVARSLIHGTSATIAVVGYGLEYFGPSRVISGVERKASQLGYTPLLTLLRDPLTNDVEGIMSGFLSRQVDGVIWAVPEIGGNRAGIKRATAGLNLPIVFITMHPDPRLATVGVHNREGGRQATAHLIEQGYQHICHVTGPMDWWEGRERLAGWQDALKEAGRNWDERDIAHGDWSAASGEQAVETLLQRHSDMDALFVGNDQMALGVLKGMRQRGLRVPEDLALVGFDDISEASYFCPPLSTVRQPLFEVGCRAAELIDQLIKAGAGEEGAGAAASFSLMPQLIVRESSRRPA